MVLCRYLPVALATAFASLLAIEPATSASTVAGTPSAQRPFSPPGYIEQVRCGYDLHPAQASFCGLLVVAESRTGKSAVTLKLPFVVFDPPFGTMRNLKDIQRWERRTASPMIFLQGGPGAFMYLRDPRIARNWYQLARIFQQGSEKPVIFFTQRGTDDLTGASLDCPLMNEPAVYLGSSEQPGQQIDWLDVVPSVAAECRQRSIAAGHDLKAYSTEDNLRDIETLRRLLHIRRWGIMASSYGTVLALEMMRRNPARIKFAVLDSPVAIGFESQYRLAGGLDSALKRLSRICASRRKCRKMTENFHADVQKLFEKLAVSPPELLIKHPKSDRHDYLIVNPAVLGDVLYSALFYRPLVQILPLAVSSALDGNWRAMRWLIAHEIYVASRTNFGTNALINCSENDVSRYAEGSDKTPHLADFVNQHARYLESLCRAYLPDNTPLAPRLPVVSPVPTLILSGVLDPLTTPAAARDVAASLQQAQIITYNSVGHGVPWNNPCAWMDVNAFVKRHNRIISITASLLAVPGYEKNICRAGTRTLTFARRISEVRFPKTR